MTSLVQLGGGRQARRPRTNHGYPLTCTDFGRICFYITFLESLLGNRLFNILDGHRLIVDAEHTASLTRRGANSSRKLWKVIGAAQNADRILPFSLIHCIIE